MMKTATPNTILPSKLAANAMAGMAATAIYLVSRLLLTPLVLSYITLAEFGLWSMCFIILSCASMGAFGVNTTYIRDTARFHAQGRDAEVNRLLSTGVFAMLVFCILFGLGLFCSLPAILDGFHVAAQMQTTAGVMILGTAAVFGLDLTLGGFRSIVEGLQEIALVKKIYTAAALTEMVAIVFFLSQGAGVRGLLYAYIVRVSLETGACMLAARRLLPALRVSPRLISRDHARRLFIFGGKVQALGGIAIFLSALDRMVISAMIGLSAAGLFEVGRKFPFTAKSVSAAAFGPFLPAAANLKSPPDNGGSGLWTARLKAYLQVALLALCIALMPIAWMPTGVGLPPVVSWALVLPAGVGAFLLIRRLGPDVNGRKQVPVGPLRRLYLDGLRHINLINTILFAFLAAVAEPLITAWVGSEYATATGVMRLLAAGYMIQQSTGPVSLIFRGIDRCGREMEYLLVQLILALAWIPAGAMAYGLTGAAAGIAAGNGTAAIFLFWRSNRSFQVGLRDFATHTLKPTLLPLILAAVVYTLTRLWPCPQRAAAVVQIVVLGLGYIGLLLPLTWKLVLTADEKKHVLALNPFRRKERQPC
ncbi:MAG: polysaccharide biosynthesis C-terminal domain-containing protein [Desulfobacterales bacterium]|nr:polysaccharide biosynthesis C-terminal domain-containing protein [Desulfobacterales bacterium]